MARILLHSELCIARKASGMSVEYSAFGHSKHAMYARHERSFVIGELNREPVKDDILGVAGELTNKSWKHAYVGE